MCNSQYNGNCARTITLPAIVLQNINYSASDLKTMDNQRQKNCDQTPLDCNLLNYQQFQLKYNLCIMFVNRTVCTVIRPAVGTAEGSSIRENLVSFDSSRYNTFS